MLITCLTIRVVLHTQPSSLIRFSCVDRDLHLYDSTIQRLFRLGAFAQTGNAPFSYVMPLRPLVPARLPLDRFSQNLILATSMKIRRETPNLVNFGQKNLSLYIKTYVRSYCWQQRVGQNNPKGRHCYFSTGTMVTQTRHNVSLHVHCLLVHCLHYTSILFLEYRPKFMAKPDRTF
jgi:hypothetical protein